MAFPVGTYINQIQDPAVRAEFEQLYSLFLGYLSQQHKDTGAHSIVSVDSVSSDLIPTTNDTYDLGKHDTTATLPFRAWRDLFLTRTLSWCGSSLSLAAQHIASWTTTLSGDNLVHAAAVATTQTQTYTSSNGVSLATIGGPTLLGGLSLATSGVTIPTLASTSVYAATSLTTPTIKEATTGASVQQQDVRTIASAGTYDFPNGSTPRGFLFITSEADNATAIFQLRGGTGSTSEVSDPVGIFSAVSGTATSTNVFWNAGTGAYRIENNRGGSRTYELVLIGAGII